jgi:hypothetical protein
MSGVRDGAGLSAGRHRAHCDSGGAGRRRAERHRTDCASGTHEGSPGRPLTPGSAHPHCGDRACQAGTHRLCQSRWRALAPVSPHLFAPGPAGSRTSRPALMGAGATDPLGHDRSGESNLIMAGASAATLLARNGHTSTPSLVRTPQCDSDGFMNMSNASTNGRQPSAWTLAATVSEYPPSATTRHSAHTA